MNNRNRDNKRNMDYGNHFEEINPDQREGNNDWRNVNSTRNTRKYGPPNQEFNDNYVDRRNQQSNWRDNDRNYGLGDTSQGSGNYGHKDNSDGSRYYGTGNLGGYYHGNERHSAGSNNDSRYGNRNDRDWWDRTSDEVASWFGDDDAERRRRKDRMEGPHKGKGPKGYVRSDEKIQDEINDKLYHDSHVDASEIEVSVNAGDVTLTGTVNDKSTKRRAEDLAEQITGVQDVTNNLKVTRTITDNRSTNQDYNESTMI